MFTSFSFLKYVTIVVGNVVTVFVAFLIVGSVGVVGIRIVVITEVATGAVDLLSIVGEFVDTTVITHDRIQITDQRIVGEIEFR